MAKIAVATMQPIADCRWSRPGHTFTGWPAAAQPEGAWVCVRLGPRREVTEAECERCPRWEAEPGAFATLAHDLPRIVT